MRILYVGNGNYKHKGARYYDIGRKLVNGMIRNGHNVYFLSDRDTARYLHLGIRWLGRYSCNQIFVDTCYNFMPDFILFGHADIITNDSLKKVRALLPQVKMAQFNVDPVFREHNILQIQSKLPYMDATFVTTAGAVLKRFNHPNGVVGYIPNPVDSSIEWPCCHERSNQPHDIFWALRALKGSYTGDPRIEYPLYLQKSGKLAIDYHGMNGKKELFDARYFDTIAKAKMGLNISVVRTYGHSPRATDEELFLYSSDRISHYMGSGLLTFTTRDNKMERLFKEDKEILFFSSKEELLEKVLYYKTHDDMRKAIARAGWEKSHQCLNERLVAKYIVETTFRLERTEDYAWPTETY